MAVHHDILIVVGVCSLLPTNFQIFAVCLLLAGTYTSTYFNAVSIASQPASHAELQYPRQGPFHSPFNAILLKIIAVRITNRIDCSLQQFAMVSLFILNASLLRCLCLHIPLPVSSYFFTNSTTRGITYTPKSSSKASGILTPEPIKRVLELPGVESVYALGDWLCLNKIPSAKWETIVSFLGSAPSGQDL